MKDLDFDEIDRAVNSLNATKPVVDENTENVEQPIVEQPVPSTRPSLPLAGRRSSGQFMDVVHPSSDMRRAPLVMPERASAPNLATNSTVFQPPVMPSESNQPTSSNEKNGWPDPIDFSGSKNEKTEVVEKPSQDQFNDADIDRISDDITNELNSQKSDEFTDSPFISGTKVEKRPLGAFSTESSPEITDQTEDTESLDGNENNTKVSQVPNDESLPDELQEDLLNIESDDHETVVEKAPVDIPVAPVLAAVTVAANQPAAPSSIVQQYKEQPSTGDQNTSAIYDTDAYHKALVTPVKKKSGWLWVLWIFILLVVGVGAGAAVYFYILPLL